MKAYEGITKAIRHSLKYGGATMNPLNFELIKDGEWLIAQANRKQFKHLRVVIEWDQRDFDTIRKLERLADEIYLLDKKYYMGFWFNTWNNTIECEIVRQEKDTEKAILEAIKLKEHEIYNLNRDESISIDEIAYEIITQYERGER